MLTLQGAAKRGASTTPGRALFSSASCEWTTPQHLFDQLAAEFGGFDLDPAATAQNAKCTRYFTRQDNGLSQPWAGRVFLNPRRRERTRPPAPHRECRQRASAVVRAASTAFRIHRSHAQSRSETP
jgi:phage N-6-adenine-methyltransferase